MDINKIINEAYEYFDDANIRRQLSEDLDSLIRIKSVSVEGELFAFGENCYRALDKAVEIAERFGLAAQNHDGFYTTIDYISNNSNAEQVGILCHLDVVPAGEGWTMPPYELTEKDGKLYGRGSLDDKGPFIASLYAIRFLKEKGIKLPFTVRLIAGADEEVGCRDIKKYLDVNSPPSFSFSPDSEFPVCIGEKGIMTVEIIYDMPKGITEISGGTVSNAVPSTARAIIEKNYAYLLIKQDGIKLEELENGDMLAVAVGKGAHAAMPEEGINAIGVLLRYLSDCGFDTGILVSAASYNDGSCFGIDREDKYFGSLTCVSSVIKSEKDKITQTLNIRYIPSTDYMEIFAAVESEAGKYMATVKLVDNSNGYLISTQDERIQALTDACSSVFGSEQKHYTTGGGSYARHMPNAVAFGCMIPGLRDSQEGSYHQADEYMHEEEMKKSIAVMAASMIELSKKNF